MKRGFLKTQRSSLAIQHPTENPNPSSHSKVIDPFHFSYGKVENQTPANLLDVGEPDMCIISTVPPKTVGVTPPPAVDNVLRTECLVDARTKREIDTCPGFPAPLLQPIQKGYYSIDSSLTAGLGVFAERDFLAGQVIFSERPLMLLPAFIMPCSRASFPKHFTTGQIKETLLYEHEKVVQRLFNRMPSEFQEAFMKLADVHTEDGSGPILGRIRTNGMGVQGIQFGKTVSEPGQPYTAIYRDASRINHSCRPNTSTEFDLSSFSLNVLAAQDIKKGDELFVHYCDLLAPASERAAELIRYSISKCNCLACSNHATSDARRRKLAQGRDKHPDCEITVCIMQGFPASKAMYFDVWAKEQIRLFEEEQLQNVHVFRYGLCLVIRQLAIQAKENVKLKDIQEIGILRQKIGQITSHHEKSQRRIER